MSLAHAPPAFERVTDLDAARAESNAGARLEALRRVARRLRERILADAPTAAVRTCTIGTFPYPTRFALGGAARTPAPYVFLTHRMLIVRTVGAGGRPLTVLVNPSDGRRVVATPFFRSLLDRLGPTLERFVTRGLRGVDEQLREHGVSPEEVDYITFDHLHTQDLRGLLAGPAPLLPRAKLLVRREELAVFEALHPLQRYWYQANALAGISPERIVSLDADVRLGAGLYVMWTPGHTAGNHTIALRTPAGIYTISENGVCADSYSPHLSSIPGLASHARRTGEEVILNANTRELSLEQYTSMILEREVADRCPDANGFVQHFASSELAGSLVASVAHGGLRPTLSIGAVQHGDVAPLRVTATTTPTAPPGGR